MSFDIPFHRTLITGDEERCLAEALASGRLHGPGPFADRCHDWFREHLGRPHVYLTKSCTAAMEMAALLLELAPGDEVIMPSFTFPATGNAFALHGASLVFVDVEPGSMNLDPAAVAAAVSPKTRAVVAVHYSGISCDMSALTETCEARGLALIEDAAQGLLAANSAGPLGTRGRFGCISFHGTKNVTAGEGGLLIVNDPADAAVAEELWDKGTDRRAFVRGEVPAYTWQRLAGSYPLGELGAAVLWAQLQAAERVTAHRAALWHRYREALAPLAAAGRIELPALPEGVRVNGHIFFLKTADGAERDRLLGWLGDRGIQATFHYQPLHAAPAGRRHGRFHGEDRHTSREADRLLRLPLFAAMTEAEVDRVVEAVAGFFGSRGG